MKKKLISLLLVFAICLSLGTVALAEDVTCKSKVEDLLDSSEMSATNVKNVKYELNLMNDFAPLLSSYIDDISYEGGNAVYISKLEGGNNEYFTIDSCINSLIINVYDEFGRQDKLEIYSDGTMMIDNSPVEFSDRVNFSDGQPAQPTAGSGAYMYDYKPFSSEEDDYTVEYKTKYGNVVTEKFIIDLTVTALSLLIAGGLGKVGLTKNMSTGLASLFRVLASNVQTKAMLVAKDARSVGYRMEILTLPELIAPLAYNYKNIVDYYLCEVSEDYLPEDMHISQTIFYEQMTLFW